MYGGTDDTDICEICGQPARGVVPETDALWCGRARCAEETMRRRAAMRAPRPAAHQVLYPDLFLAFQVLERGCERPELRDLWPQLAAVREQVFHRYVEHERSARAAVA